MRERTGKKEKNRDSKKLGILEKTEKDNKDLELSVYRKFGFVANFWGFQGKFSSFEKFQITVVKNCQNFKIQKFRIFFWFFLSKK